MRELEKHWPNAFQVSIHTGLLCLRPEALIDSFNALVSVIIYNKLDNYFFVSADRQTFLGFEMTANLSDTSSLYNACIFFSQSVKISNLC